MPIPPPEKITIWRVAELVVFATIVALFMFVSSSAGMRGLGMAILTASAVQMFKRRISYGWAGREPSGYITGVPAVVMAVFGCMLGIAMLVHPDLMLRFWGENNGVHAIVSEQ